MTNPMGERADLLVRGGLLVDGSSDAVPVPGDVAVRDGWVVAVGDCGRIEADRTIDAAGLVVAPGFIDPHVHIEAAILDERDDATAPSLQGVTTVLTAPDGFGWAPLSSSQAAELWRSTAGIHGPWPGSADPAAIGSWLGSFVGRSPVNLLPQAPGSAIRFAAMGWGDGEPDRSALDRMRGLVGEWLDAGAAGLAVGLDYEPGARAGEAELTALAAVVGDRGGTLAAHIRYEDAGRPAGYAEMARIGRRSGARIVLAHERLDGIGMEGAAGFDAAAPVTIEAYGYNASSTHLGICLPAWARAGGPGALAARLADRVQRSAIAGALGLRLDEDRATGDRIVFAASNDPTRIGIEIHECAAKAGLAIGDFAAACLADDPTALFVYRHDGRFDHEAVEAETWRDDRTIVASDGIYVDGRMHPRGYGTFPRVLRRAVRERGTIGLAAAIHRMTGRTAAVYGVPDRGVVRTGAAADLVVFDPTTVTDEADWEAPRRPPTGIEVVIVGGTIVVERGVATGARPGRVLAASRPSSARP